MRQGGDWLPETTLRVGATMLDNALISCTHSPPLFHTTTQRPCHPSVYLLSLHTAKNLHIDHHEVCRVCLADGRGNNDQAPAPAPLCWPFDLLTRRSSPLRSNMSSANRGAGPSSRRNKRARDDGDLPSSAAHPPSSREYNAKMDWSKQLTACSNGFLSAHATPR